MRDNNAILVWKPDIEQDEVDRSLVHQDLQLCAIFWHHNFVFARQKEPKKLAQIGVIVENRDASLLLIHEWLAIEIKFEGIACPLA